MTAAPPLEVVVVLAFAAFRGVHLVTTDSITLAWREGLFKWAWVELPKPYELDGDGNPITHAPRAGAWRTWVYELFTCPWCLGVWASAVAYCAWRWGGDVAHAVLWIGAIAGGQSLLASRADV